MMHEEEETETEIEGGGGGQEAAANKKPVRRGLRNKNQAIVNLNSIIEKILRHIKSAEISKLFRTPVSTKVAPDYYEKIKKPMDLGRMLHIATNTQYDSLQSFIDDFDLMVSNCYEYNGLNPNLKWLLDTASSLKAMLDEQLYQKRDELCEIFSILSGASSSSSSPPSLHSSQSSSPCTSPRSSLPPPLDSLPLSSSSSSSMFLPHGLSDTSSASSIGLSFSSLSVSFSKEEDSNRLLFFFFQDRDI